MENSPPTDTQSLYASIKLLLIVNFMYSGIEDYTFQILKQNTAKKKGFSTQFAYFKLHVFLSFLDLSVFFLHRSAQISGTCTRFMMC